MAQTSLHILITGGSGFLGSRLARALLTKSELSLWGSPPQPIGSILLTDIANPPSDLANNPRVRFVGGDLLGLLEAKTLPTPDIDLIFHLAAAVSGECEANFDLGMRSNLEATHQLLEACRNLGSCPTLVFSSSVAVFGATSAQLEWVDDQTLPTPQSSYGTQKFMGELLVADYTRRGFVSGRSVRLMTISVRPGKPNKAASGFLSGIIREPLAGMRAVCPVPAQTAVVLASPARAIEGLIRAAEASEADWGPPTALNLPALATTVGEMVAALEQVAGKRVVERIDWIPDPAIQRIVQTWPGRVVWSRATGLGLRPDADFASIIRDYIRENPQAVKLESD